MIGRTQQRVSDDAKRPHRGRSYRVALLSINGVGTHGARYSFQSMRGRYWPVRTYRQWRKEVCKREGTGCSMSGARIFLCTYIRVAASETSIQSCG